MGEEGLAGIWRALDDDCSGVITLREWDQKSFDELSEFKTWADRAHHGATKAFRALDAGAGNSKVSSSEFMKARHAADPCKADLPFLFDSLDVSNSWGLSEHDVKFLDSWDLAWEDYLATIDEHG